MIRNRTGNKKKKEKKWELKEELRMTNRKGKRERVNEENKNIRKRNNFE